MKIIAFDGSPRKNGNSTILLNRFCKKAESLGAEVNIFKTDELDLKTCRGCLFCNTKKRCIIKNDDWAELSEEILGADVLAFASPIYFHHTTSSMKRLIDRFRSFIKVQITEESIIHTTHQDWVKKLYLFTAHGSSSEEDAYPLINMFKFINDNFRLENELKYITAVRLAFSGQIAYTRGQLSDAYRKLGISEKLVDADYERNKMWLDETESLAEELFK